MQVLWNEVARENGVEVAMLAPKESTFYFTYAKQQHDMTFAALVIRCVLLKARPEVAESVRIVGGVVNMALLEYMEAVLCTFPVSEADASGAL
jgi:hypothetical protein